MPGMDCYRDKVAWLADHPGPGWVKITPFPVVKYTTEPRDRDADIARVKGQRDAMESRAKKAAGMRAVWKSRHEARAREEEALETKQLERLERRLAAIERSLESIVTAMKQKRPSKAHTPAEMEARRLQHLDAVRKYKAATA